MDDKLYLTDFSFAIYDVPDGNIKMVDPSTDEPIAHRNLPRGIPERAARAMYRHVLGHHTLNVNHKINSALQDAIAKSQGIEPEPIMNQLNQLVRAHVSIPEDKECLDVIDTDGVPDLFVQNKRDGAEFYFVEVKQPNEPRTKDQVEWMERFDFLPIKILKVFRDPSKRDSFVDSHSLADIFEKDGSRFGDTNRPEMTPDEIEHHLREAEVGDSIIFNDRARAYPVVGTGVENVGYGPDIEGVEVESP